MKLQCTINNEIKEINIEGQEKLSNVLRDLGYLSVKQGCGKGFCSSCMILFNETPVPSCIIPGISISEAKIETLEYFETTEEYSDIQKAFNQSNLHFCGYCNAGKIFSTYDIICKSSRPTKVEIFDAVKNILCDCTETEEFIKGIQLAATYRRNRLGNLKYEKK